MEEFRPTIRALAGAALGALAALAGALLAQTADHGVSAPVILVLVIALVGLVLGAGAATYAYLAAAVVTVATLAAQGGSAQLELEAAVRLAVFLVGTPVIVALVDAAERARRATEEARDAAQAASRAAERERAVVTEARREAEHAQRRAEIERASMVEVAEAIPEALIVYDESLRGTYGNHAALRILGRSFFERDLDEWAHAAEPRDEDGRPLPREAWPQVRAQQGPLHERIRLRVPMSGRDLLLEISGTPVPGGGCVLLLRDVHEEEEKRQRLSRFASFVAHELRNPLAVAKARIELAGRGPGKESATTGHPARALESVDAAIGILERLELYSRADAGQIEADRLAFALRPSAEAAIESLRVRGSEREIEVDVPPDLVVLGDRYLSEQAIVNLLSNADRYSKAGARVRIEASGDDPIALRVIDAGPGISDETAAGLFHDRASSGRGLGLGLYLVHHSMKAMGGSVELERRQPNAVFTLRWPRAAAER